MTTSLRIIVIGNSKHHSPQSSIAPITATSPLQKKAFQLNQLYNHLSFNMNATQQVSRRFVVGMGPRLTTPVRYSSTATAPKDKSFMRACFTTGTLVTAGGVTFAVSVPDPGHLHERS